MAEKILDPTTGEKFVSKVSVCDVADPVLAQAASTPSDYSTEYPNMIDPTELLAGCEELTVWQALPEVRIQTKSHHWLELDSLAFNSGSHALAFGDCECPCTFDHDSDEKYVTLKNLGAYKSLCISDIMDSAAKAGIGMGAVNRLIGGIPAGEGVPGGSSTASFASEYVADLKEKMIRLSSTLVLNGWDRMLILGDDSVVVEEFDGIEPYFAGATACAHVNWTSDDIKTGTFSAASFDRFLAESCAKPTHLFGHPQAIQELLSGYFQLGFAGSQVVNFSDGNRITPGFNFAGYVNTGVGRLACVADNNFTRTNTGGGMFQSGIYGLRMTHNGDPLVYKVTQIPLAWKDLTPGCTSVQFQVWTKTALVIKHCCAHSWWQGVFTGKIVSTCTAIG